jgi:hypothetical protein
VKLTTQEYVDLYIHSPIRLHGVVLNNFSFFNVLICIIMWYSSYFSSTDFSFDLQRGAMVVYR